MTPVTTLTLFLHDEMFTSLLLSDDGSNKIWVGKGLFDHIPEPMLEGETPEIELDVPIWLAEKNGWV